MSLKSVALISFGIIVFLLWGGAAAIYKSHVTPVNAPAAELVGAGDDEGDGHDGPTGVTRVRVGRGAGLAAAIVVMVLGVITFLANSITQLNHLPSVISLICTERHGYLLFCVGVLAVTGLFFLWMGKVQQSLESGNPFQKKGKKRKLPKIRTPKGID